MTTTIQHTCTCQGRLNTLETNGHSTLLRCTVCGHSLLRIEHTRFERLVMLRDFHLKRGAGPQQRPFNDLAMATRLVDCLGLELIPSPATTVDFGINSLWHYRALQYAVRVGLTPYDLDRVMGDGQALTTLICQLPDQPYADIEFRTVYDSQVLGIQV